MRIKYITFTYRRRKKKVNIYYRVAKQHPFPVDVRKEDPLDPPILLASNEVAQQFHDIPGELHITICYPLVCPLAGLRLLPAPFCLTKKRTTNKQNIVRKYSVWYINNRENNVVRNYYT